MDKFVVVVFPIAMALLSVLSYKVGQHDGEVNTFAGSKDHKEFIEWRDSCKAKWNTPCGLNFFELNGVGVYQVSPYEENKND